MNDDAVGAEQTQVKDAQVWQNLIEEAQEAWRRGNGERTGDLYGRVVAWSRGYLLAIALAKLPDDMAAAFAEDYVSDVHVELWTRIVKGAQIVDVKALMRRILLNHIYDEYRRRNGKSQGHEDDEFWAGYPAPTGSIQSDPADTLESLDTIRAWNTVLEQLPPKEKEVFEARVVKGLSTREAADYLKLTEDKVKKCLKAARLRIGEIATERGLMQ